MPLGQWGFEIDIFSRTAVIPNNNLAAIDHTRLAVSVFMSGNEQFEMLQGYYGEPFDWIGVKKLKNSYYSEEDLTSDIIGFYIGSERLLAHVPSGQLKEKVRKLCHAVGPVASLDVLRESYGSGTKAVTNWRHWYPRIVPLIGCNTGMCGTRTWPSDFAKLTSSRINPSTGVWHWYKASEDGGIVTTERTGVVRFSNVLAPTP